MSASSVDSGPDASETNASRSGAIALMTSSCKLSPREKTALVPALSARLPFKLPSTIMALHGRAEAVGAGVPGQTW
jgi:hypothetical protein